MEAISINKFKGNAMRNRCQWRKRLKGRGYRLTISREAIINALRSTDKHLSAEDIYLTLHSKYPEIGLTTIYRTLELLDQMGIISKFDFGDSRARYELSGDYGNKAHHHHLICTNCLKIIDYTDFIDDELELLNKTQKELSGKYNFDITGHLIRFYGLCDECKEEKNT